MPPENSASGGGVTDPFRQVDTLMATYAEKWWAAVNKGIPPIAASVMLGTEMGVFMGFLATVNADEGGAGGE